MTTQPWVPMLSYHASLGHISQILESEAQPNATSARLILQQDRGAVAQPWERECASALALLAMQTMKTISNFFPDPHFPSPGLFLLPQATSAFLRFLEGKYLVFFLFSHNSIMGRGKYIADDQRCRNICFTWNNFPEDWQAQLQARMPPFKHLIGGVEFAPTTGTPHIQGYVEFKNSVKGSTLKKKFKMHMEERIKSAEQASGYCEKECDPATLLKIGTHSRQGNRRDISAVRELIQEGHGMRAVLNDDTLNGCQAVRFAQTYLTYCERPREHAPIVCWFYGKAGTSKTARAIMYAKRIAPDNWHLQGNDAQWWDGFDGHEVLIIDDLREDKLSFTQLLYTLDRVPQRLPIKGGFRQNTAKYIFITSAYAPECVYNTNEDLHQLTRRITHIAQILSNTTCSIEKGDALPPFTEEELCPPPREGSNPPTFESFKRREEVCEEGTPQSGDEERVES